MRIFSKKDRIKALVDHFCGGKKGAFALMIGVTPQALSTWISRDTFDIELIFAKCEGVNPEWLLTGRGEMLRETKCSKSEKTELSSIQQTANTESKDSNNKVFTQDHLYIIDKLFQQLEEKDAKIEELSKEIGRLEQTIEGFAQKYDTAGTVRTANAG